MQTKQETMYNCSVPALYVFGDSTVDPGNNNHLNTIVKANFPPYGRDFANHTPSGRFTNGRLVSDFVASYLGLDKYPLPYLDPTLCIEELMTGACFASAASGNDPLTPQFWNVISMTKQVEYFREYKTKLEAVIGKNRAEDQINKALFLVSTGSNDIAVNYFGLGAQIRQKNFTVQTYEQFLLQHVQQFIQGLWDGGARKIGISGLPPVGCLPVVITLHPGDNIPPKRNCIETFNLIAREYNTMLKNELSAMQSSLAKSGASIAYLDIYTPLSDMIQGHKYCFDEVDKGCCGTGLFEESVLCNPISSVCTDASKYVFWDASHPTERGYFIIFEAVRPTIDSIIMGSTL